MTKDEVLAVLDELILSHKSSWGRMSDYPLVRATQDEALAAVAALYEERDALAGWKARHKPAVSAAYAILDAARPTILNLERLRDAEADK